MNRFEQQQADQFTRNKLRASRGRNAGLKKGNLSEIVADGAQNRASQALDTSSETLPFGLTPEEKRLIERDIHAQQPIGVGESMPAYQKFLNSVFNSEVSVSPYLASHTDALSIITALKELFPDKKNSLRLANAQEADESLNRNNHLTGYRSADSVEVESAGIVGCAWVDGDMRGENAPCVWRDRYDGSGHNWNGPQSGLSVIPVFG